MKSPIPAEMRPDQVVAIIDTREQLPLALHPLRVEVGTLATGDYSVLGLENVVAIERKASADLLGCIGREWERFDKEVVLLLAYPVRAIIIESTWGQIEAGNWKSKVTASAAIGSLLGWVAAGVPIIMAENHEAAGRYVSRLLFTAARRRWRDLGRWPPPSAPRRTPRSRNPYLAVGTARRSTARSAAVGERETWLPIDHRPVDAGGPRHRSGARNRAKRTSTVIRGGEIRPRSFWGRRRARSRGCTPGRHVGLGRKGRRPAPGQPRPRRGSGAYDSRGPFSALSRRRLRSAIQTFKATRLTQSSGSSLSKRRASAHGPGHQKTGEPVESIREVASLQSLQPAFSYSPFVVPVSNPLVPSSEALVILSISRASVSASRLPTGEQHCKNSPSSKGSK